MEVIMFDLEVNGRGMSCNFPFLCLECGVVYLFIFNFLGKEFGGFLIFDCHFQGTDAGGVLFFVYFKSVTCFLDYLGFYMLVPVSTSC